MRLNLKSPLGGSKKSDKNFVENLGLIKKKGFEMIIKGKEDV